MKFDNLEVVFVFRPEYRVMRELEFIADEQNNAPVDLLVYHFLCCPKLIEMTFPYYQAELFLTWAIDEIRTVPIQRVESVRLDRDKFFVSVLISARDYERWVDAGK